MYHSFFGLQEPAFSIAVNPRYLYMSQQHKEALAHLLYGVTGGGFVMLTGEVGTGKTTIIRCLLEQMPHNVDIAILLNPMLNVAELLTAICDELDISHNIDHSNIKNLTDSLHQFLLKNHMRGRKTIVLIDEAQLLSIQALEQVRLLTNLETTTQKLLHIILVGQPELKELLAKPELRQLAQRITARFHLAPLTLKETYAYIAHRLHIAGWDDNKTIPFSPSIIKQIHAATSGVPRLINVVCERCLMGAYAKNQSTIDKNTLKAASLEVMGNNTTPKAATSSSSLRTLLLSGILISSLLGALLFFANQQTAPTPVKMIATHSIASSSSSSQASSAPNTQYRNYKEAEDKLFSYIGLPIVSAKRPCGKNTKINYACVKTELQTWQQIIELNRPVILMMATPDKFSSYAVLIGLNDTHALILNEKDEKTSVPLATLGRQWTGEVAYLWKKPPAFNDTILAGDQSDSVTWVAQQFATLDKQKEPLTTDIFTVELYERIKLFQQSKNIEANGNIDRPTLLKLNDEFGIDKTLLTTF